MKVSEKRLAVVCFAMGAAMLCAAQSDGPSSANPPAVNQPVSKDNPAQPPEGGAVSGKQSPGKQKGTAEANACAPSKPGVETPYVIGPLDVLDVKVWNQAQLSGPVAVGPNGTISMQLIGEVKADGLTTQQVKEAISKRLVDFLNNPEVEVTLAKNNSKKFFVYGGVQRSGPYPLLEKTTIMDALSEVGFKDFANMKKITIQRGDQTCHFNYNDFRKGRNMDKNVNIELRNGDRIFVPE